MLGLNTFGNAKSFRAPNTWIASYDDVGRLDNIRL